MYIALLLTYITLVIISHSFTHHNVCSLQQNHYNKASNYTVALAGALFSGVCHDFPGHMRAVVVLLCIAP